MWAKDWMLKKFYHTSDNYIIRILDFREPTVLLSQGLQNKSLWVFRHSNFCYETNCSRVDGTVLPQVDALVGGDGSVDEVEECCGNSPFLIASFSHHIICFTLDLVHCYHLKERKWQHCEMQRLLEALFPLSKP